MNLTQRMMTNERFENLSIMAQQGAIQGGRLDVIDLLLQAQEGKLKNKTVLLEEGKRFVQDNKANEAILILLRFYDVDFKFR